MAESSKPGPVRITLNVLGDISSITWLVDLVRRWAAGLKMSDLSPGELIVTGICLLVLGVTAWDWFRISRLKNKKTNQIRARIQAVADYARQKIANSLQPEMTIDEVVRYIRLHVSDMDHQPEHVIFKLIQEKAAQGKVRVFGRRTKVGEFDPIDRDMFLKHKWVFYRSIRTRFILLGPGETASRSYLDPRIPRKDVETVWP
jgi:hypothetical protein